MPRLTVADTIDIIDWGRIAGICPRLSDGAVDPRVYSFLNRASYRLLNRGDFIGTTQLARFCLDSGCFTVPRAVERIDEAMFNGVTLSPRNPLFQFVDRIGDQCGNRYWWGYGPFTWYGRDLEDRGYYATYKDINPGSKKIRIYPDSPNDNGKIVYVQATDDNNQIIYEDADYNGIKLIIASPYVESTQFISNIMGIIKPETEKNLNLYEVATLQADNLRLLGIYEPSETTIELRRYRIPGVCSTNPACNSLLALVKLKHVPVKRETDYLVIENPAAFEEMIRCLESKDAGNPQEAQIAEIDAVRELNLEKRNRSPVRQIAVKVLSQGTANPRYHNVGGMT